MKTREQIFVTTASGENAPFHEDKLETSLRRTRADDSQIDQIFSEISNGRLKEPINEFGLYAITCLSSLTQAEMQQLSNKKHVYAKQIRIDRILLSGPVMKEPKVKK